MNFQTLANALVIIAGFVQKTKLLKLYREVRKATTALSDKGPTGGDRAKSPWGNAKWGNQGLSSNEGGQSVGKAGGSLDPTHI